MKLSRYVATKEKKKQEIEAKEKLFLISLFWFLDCLGME